MDIYEYRGRNKTGDLMRGTIEAASPEGVVSWMTSMGISPIDVRLKVDPLKGQPAWLKALQGARALNSNDLLLFTRQIGTMVKSGVALIQAINSLKNSSANPAMTELLRSISASLDRGSELSAAMSEHQKFFGEYYINMVKVGETTGKLDEIFDRLFTQLDFDRRMRQKIKSVLRYPMFVMSAIVIAILIMMVYIVPVFAKIYDSMNVDLPAVTQILIGTSHFISKNWWLLLIVAAGIFWLSRKYLSSAEGRYQWDRYKLRLPVVGSLLTKATTARFCRSFATAMKAGVPIVTSLTLVSRVVENAFYAERINSMREGISNGESILRTFLTAGIFSPIEIQMITVGEETGDVDTMIQQLADLYQEEVEYEANRLAESLEPILLAFMAVLVIILLLGIFLPMWNLTAVVK
jgi:MSHA biogenesis protein MshG